MKNVWLNLGWSLLNLFVRVMLFLAMIAFVMEKDHDKSVHYGISALIFGLWVAVEEIKSAIRKGK